jgi:hypothetical protein
MIRAALLFIARVAETTTVSQVTGDYVEDGCLHISQDKDIRYYATIFRIHGPFCSAQATRSGWSRKRCRNSRRSSLFACGP